MLRQQKLIGSALIVHAVYGVGWICESFERAASPALFVALNVLLAVLGLSAGIGYLKQADWARSLAQLFYFVQIPQLAIGFVAWSFTLGLQMVFSVGWIDFGQIGVNVVALAMLIWITRFRRQPVTPAVAGEA
ncbi:hypothetical protein [Dyella acidiphila]|uniref:Uncharacterized protein n=1 Tax=Dyella acidiphila TaxID=2775866 RepID=A0ABR9G662_9GAMM|nr:hypothetical protein [Dyella acidiphila]MBE1159533.1 hypothetical protein [Dyella acidiphila]